MALDGFRQVGLKNKLAAETFVFLMTVLRVAGPDASASSYMWQDLQTSWALLNKCHLYFWPCILVVVLQALMSACFIKRWEFDCPSSPRGKT